MTHWWWPHYKKARWGILQIGPHVCWHKSINGHPLLGCFLKPKVNRKQSRLVGTSIRGFGQRQVPTIGTTSLDVTFGKGRQETTRKIKFIVVRMVSKYNEKLGRMALHALQAVASSYHQCLKFPTEPRICTIKRSQQRAYKCYINSSSDVLLVEIR